MFPTRRNPVRKSFVTAQATFSVYDNGTRRIRNNCLVIRNLEIFVILFFFKYPRRVCGKKRDLSFFQIIADESVIKNVKSLIRDTLVVWIFRG